ncbi:MAG: T9SS type A sorting domain-containing protein, partial [Bacteroidetes bacterium]|nr:T9SS type A sorting domain-containing protein [Bacteroidota bacterium]
VFLSGNTICQNIEGPFKADSIACDTFPPPRNLDGLTFDNTVMLWWEVPLSEVTDNKTDSAIPQNLIAYFLIKDGELLDSIPFTGDDTSYYYDYLSYPTAHDYSVSALYDLSPCGYPGEVAESEYAGPVTFYGFGAIILSFIEDWNTGSFDPNLWVHNTNWIVNGQYGNPLPTAEYISTWNDTNYRQGITSYWLDCRHHPGTFDPYIDGDFYLEFDSKLHTLYPTGTEFLKIEIQDSIGWQTIYELSNADGATPWISHKLNITEWVKGWCIRIAFVAEGENSANIIAWFVDNIYVYHKCNPPRDLQWVVFDEVMAWRPPLPHTTDHHDTPRELQGYNVMYDDSLLSFTTDTFHILDQSLGYGPYWVWAEYEDCGPFSDYIYGPMGIIKNNAADKINIYPNPADEQITISAQKYISSVKVFNVHGEQLIRSEPHEKQCILDTHGIPNGIYIIQLSTGNDNVSRKIIIRH